ncbi:hypothetical protein NDU88_006320 [Pleurodeles waltl]|uniref:Uncharacterized protein n=1 Tax=Pleurodeles waltl TaxID=8319 RepID=A0AAV7NPX4_PLEWA|nr:hypothetical protein NDU88_006320 [Pleurodeles waltl]
MLVEAPTPAEEVKALRGGFPRDPHSPRSPCFSCRFFTLWIWGASACRLGGEGDSCGFEDFFFFFGLCGGLAWLLAGGGCLALGEALALGAVREWLGPLSCVLGVGGVGCGSVTRLVAALPPLGWGGSAAGLLDGGSPAGADWRHQCETLGGIFLNS